MSEINNNDMNEKSVWKPDHSAGELKLKYNNEK